MNRQKQIIIYQLSIIIVPLAPSTSVEDSLQISSFLTNKANFLDAKMNVSTNITVDYENIANCKLGENEPKTNPIKANFTSSQRPVLSHAEGRGKAVRCQITALGPLSTNETKKIVRRAC